jgi:DNA modification methylase
MPQLDIKFDVCITDPPYGTTRNKWDNIIPFEPMWDSIYACVKFDGAICLFGNEPFSSLLRCSNLKYFRYDWTWYKNNATGFLNSKKQPLRCIETISIFYREQPVYNPQMRTGFKPYVAVHNSHTENYGYHKGAVTVSNGDRFPVQMLNIKCNSKSKLHPTQKPVELMEYLIKTYTNEGDVVLDFTAGSGSTGIATIRTNRKCVMIEKEEKYCEIIVERIENEYKTMAERIF